MEPDPDKSSPAEIEDFIARLRAEIARHNRLYHTENAPQISDAEYDAKFARLRELERLHPDLASADSPTNRVGAPPSDKLALVRRARAMLSLDNVFSSEQLKKFHDRIRKAVGRESRCLVSPKIDGVALALVYENGFIAQALTRGDGLVGEDVTHNLGLIDSIPDRLDRAIASGRLEIRGEVFCPKKSFRKMNEARALKGAALRANERNYTAGALRRIDSTLPAPDDARLDFIPFALIDRDESAKTLTERPIESISEALEILRSIGFNPIEARAAEDFESMLALIEEIGAEREEKDFQIDGAVVTLDQIGAQEELGSTSRAPLYAVAYKFPSQTGRARVERIEFQIGRTGAVTPVAILEPISIGGSTIQRATLHNIDQLLAKNIRTRDTALVTKAGDIIPRILQRLNDPDRPPAGRLEPELTRCPSCDERLHRNERSANLFCRNRACRARRLAGAIHFVSRDAMNIKSLGARALEAMFDNGLIEEVADIYFLKPQQIMTIEKFREKSTENILLALEKSKDVRFDRLFFALGIEHVGKETARLIVEKFGSIDNILDAIETSRSLEVGTILKALAIPGIGPKSAEEIGAKFDSIDQIFEADKDDLLGAGAPEKIVDLIIEFRADERALAKIARAPFISIDRIGVVIIDSIIEFFSDEANRRSIDKLRRAGLKLSTETDAERSRGGELVGKKFVITGRLDSMSRERAEELIVRAGAHARADLSARTDYLVVGSNPGSKLARAESINEKSTTPKITIIDEPAFNKLIDSAERGKI